MIIIIKQFQEYKYSYSNDIKLNLCRFKNYKMYFKAEPRPIVNNNFTC